MGGHLLWQRVQEGVHGDVQKRLGGDRLKRLRRGAFPDDANAVQDDDLLSRFQMALRCTSFMLLVIVWNSLSRKGYIGAESGPSLQGVRQIFVWRTGTCQRL